jgi:hypothetical protein
VSDIEVITFRPDPGQYAWTFGGAAPAMRIRPPAVLKVFTEDCFAGPLYQATLSMVSPKSQASSRSSDPVRRAMPGSQPCALAGLTVAQCGPRSHTRQRHPAGVTVALM